MLQLITSKENKCIWSIKTRPQNRTQGSASDGSEQFCLIHTHVGFTTSPAPNHWWLGQNICEVSLLLVEIFPKCSLPSKHLSFPMQCLLCTTVTEFQWYLHLTSVLQQVHTHQGCWSLSRLAQTAKLQIKSSSCNKGFLPLASEGVSLQLPMAGICRCWRNCLQRLRSSAKEIREAADAVFRSKAWCTVTGFPLPKSENSPVILAWLNRLGHCFIHILCSHQFDICKCTWYLFNEAIMVC